MIEVVDIRKNHTGRVVLDGVDLTLAPGQIEAVVGPSGGGKTTLLRCLLGLTPFDAGEVRVGELRLRPGADERADAATLRSLRRAVGVVFQQLHLFPHLTALGNLTLAPVRSGGESVVEATDRARALLARVGLGDRADAYPAQLSGGQQQRVAIARALMTRPQALLLDEPTSALDPARTLEIQALLSELARDGLALLLVTHSLGFARRLASRVHVLDLGRVVESGPPAQVFDAPAHPSTRALLEAF